MTPYHTARVRDGVELLREQLALVAMEVVRCEQKTREEREATRNQELQRRFRVHQHLFVSSLPRVKHFQRCDSDTPAAIRDAEGEELIQNQWRFFQNDCRTGGFWID